MYTTTDFRNGLKIEFEGDPYVIVYFQHVKPGKGGAFVRTKLKNLKTGSVLEHTFRSGDKVSKPDLEERGMQFLYREGNAFHFMDTGSYEQIYLDEDHMGDAANYMIENLAVKILFFRGEPIGIDLPIFIALAISETEPGVRGDTVSGATKQAKLQSGAIVQVPLFLNEGDRVKVDTRTGTYIERA
ncbi:MAG TPA: elongation factor P [Deltaproteobacteria bacterium]|nr:MAG: elongation factor P [Deltaproteobacteria bacterium GWC2_65_14]HBO70617.1 elongation factor P [Deltaproteobacteria bacterium]